MLTPLPVSLSVWLAQPSAEAIARAEASSPGDLLTRSGKAAMVCVVRGDGRLDACRIDDAKSDPGFAAPILALADKYLLDMTHPPADSRVEVAVAFPRLVDGPLKPTAAPASSDFVARLPPGLHGGARMNCLVTVRGDTTDCVIEDAAAHDARLATAALALASKFRFEPPTLRGHSTGAATAIRLATDAHVIRAPSWAHVPSGADLSAAYPQIALASHLGGTAAIRCVVGIDGALADCQVVSESPAGLGFGDAALKMAPKFRMRPQTSDGNPVVGGVVTIPINFQTDPPPQPHAFDGASFRLLPWVPWDAAPTSQDVVAAFPQRALAARLFGRAALLCDIASDGALKRCSSTMEAPDGAGFGAAALRLAPKFHMIAGGMSAAVLRNVKVAISIDFSERSLQPAAERYVRRPEWLRTIDGGELGAAFPAAAIKAGVLGGTATVHCRIGVIGFLEACRVEKQDPPELGFGEAGLTLAPLMQANLWTKDGEPAVGQSIVLPIRFVYASPIEPAAPAK